VKFTRHIKGGTSCNILGTCGLGSLRSKIFLSRRYSLTVAVACPVRLAISLACCSSFLAQCGSQFHSPVAVAFLPSAARNFTRLLQ
jgi:hypothetical protein